MIIILIDGGGGRFVDDMKDSKIGDSIGVFGSGLLSIVEVYRYVRKSMKKYIYNYL